MHAKLHKVKTNNNLKSLKIFTYPLSFSKDFNSGLFEYCLCLTVSLLPIIIPAAGGVMV